MQKNDEFTGKVLSYGTDGEGVIKQDEKVVFVPFAIPKETVEYKILKVKGNIAYGKLIRVKETSDCRRIPECPAFYKCGGCNLQHVEYKEQLAFKKRAIKDAFYKIAKIDIEPSDVVTGEKEFRYRNKLQLPVAEIDGKTEIGFYARNSHRVVPISDCLINPIWTKDIISAFKEYFSFGIKGYDEIKGTGDVREIAVREVSGNLIITVVTPNGKELKERDALVSILKKGLKKEFSLFQNVNVMKNNVVFGEEFRSIYGGTDYTATMLGIKYKVGVRSFTQVNTEVCEKLYGTVKSEIGEEEDLTVIDAYSGAGLMTAILSKGVKKAIGIEIVPEAVEIANELSKENGVADKVRNYLGKCEEIMPDIIKKEEGKIAVVLDPPRKGCDIKVIEAVKNSGTGKIVYVSCMPSTLARDVGLITGSLVYDGKNIVFGEGNGNYKIDKIVPFDMFPNTKHIETMVVLSKK